MRRKFVVPVLALAGLVLAGIPVQAGLEAPTPLDRFLVEGFHHRNADEDLLLIQSWTGIDIEFDEDDGGLSGTLLAVVDYLVQDRDYLEFAAMVSTFEQPRYRLKDVEARVLREGSDQRFGRKDLVWHQVTQRSDGVVTLDGTISQAMIPGIRVGDRIRILTRYQLKGTFGFPPIPLGDAANPYLSTGLEIRLPEGYQLVWGGTGVAGGRDRLVYRESRDGSRQVHRWTLDADQDGSLPVCRENHPAFEVVAHVARAEAEDRSIAVGTDWATVGEAYLSLIDGIFEPDPALIDLTRTVTADCEDPLEKIDRIYQTVQKRCRYLGLYEGTGAMVPIPAPEVLASGFGDCKGLGTLLIAMLRVAGFEAHPVLVLSGGEGKLDPAIPNMAQFNHYIAWVDTGDGGIFLDGTVENCPAGVVPLEDAGSPVLLVRPGEVEMMEIPHEAWHPGRQDLVVEGNIDPDGRLDLEYALTVSGNLARQWRHYLEDRPSARGRVIRGSLMPDGLAMMGGDGELVGLDDWGGSLEIRLSAELAKPLPGDHRSFFLPRILTGSVPDFDPTLVCGRNVDLRRWTDRRESWRIAVPAGLTLARPDSLVVDDGGVTWACRIWQEGATLRLERSLIFAGNTLSPVEADAVEAKLLEGMRSDAGYLELIRD